MSHLSRRMADISTINEKLRQPADNTVYVHVCMHMDLQATVASCTDCELHATLNRIRSGRVTHATLSEITWDTTFLKLYLIALKQLHTDH